ncbi:zinc ribbon domain-containing protein [Gorillibacterium massiliense]|uniref:zinc ribbon domain-containing protein n=1 Tax=Gorillibacterium massiliense TaxID=1280390 RepID=UPI0004B9E8A2|nr:zinc ribbon domain-containing protein [Gorillibacterium massiliense]
MKNFFDKMKDGAQEAARLAQQTVETTKLKTQIYGLEKDVDRLYLTIGRQVYRSFEQHGTPYDDQEFISVFQEIHKLLGEIDELERKIREIRNEKECACGKALPVDAKFCPNCGASFAPPRSVDADVIPVTPEASDSGSSQPVQESAQQESAQEQESQDQQVKESKDGIGE